MTNSQLNRPLRIFLCHSSGDKPSARGLYRRLREDGFAPWLDEEDLLPGMDWQAEIPKAVRNSDVVIVCLSRGSITKAGYVQKEIKFALDVADEQPEGAIFLIPLKLEECDVPERLARWQWVNQLETNGYARLVRSLRYRAESLNLSTPHAMAAGSSAASDQPIVPDPTTPIVGGGMNVAAAPSEQMRETCIRSLENSLPNQTLLTERFVHLLWTKLAELAPLFPGTGQGDSDEFLVNAIEQAAPLVVEFSRVCEVIAAVNAVETARSVYKEFGLLIDEISPPSRFSGSFYHDHGDFYRFIGHELFVTLIAFLLNKGRWSLITDILDEEIYVHNSPSGRSGTVPFTHLSDGVESLRRRNQRLNLKRVSLHADILNERHTTGEISNVVSMRQFMDADYFLFLREDFGWRPWSTLYIGSQAPRYLAEAVATKRAEQLLQPLRVSDIAALRKLVSERNTRLRELFRGTFSFFPLEDFDVRSIGSK